MFVVSFKTEFYKPDLLVTLRNNVDGWQKDLPGLYEADAWRFELDEARYPAGFEFKFVLERNYWMQGGNFAVAPVAGGDYAFSENQVQFPAFTEAIVENTYFQHLFFRPELNEQRVFDVIVIGSGIGGGVLADQLSDYGLDVLVLEAGSLLFPTHVGNLPRRHRVGQFEKHLWDLYESFRVENYTNAPNSEFKGGQGFNLGGRSVFWGGLIPRMTGWELNSWPASIKNYLESAGYQKAEDLIYWPLQATNYQQSTKLLLANILPQFHHFDAPVAVRNPNPARGTLSTGVFSTADLLTESRMTDDDAGSKRLTINLSHAVTKVSTNHGHVTSVTALDLLSNVSRVFKSKYVAMCAGTVESAKLAKLSGLADPSNKVGVGITDHPIYYTHFSVPPGSQYHSPDQPSKTLSRHQAAAGNSHPYNMVLELGSDLNQGRYLDPDILARHRQLSGNVMLCEIVFLFNSPLVEQNLLSHNGSSATRPVVSMQHSPSALPYLQEITNVKNQVIQQLGGQPILGDDLSLKRAGLGGVAHEVGTLRLGVGAAGVVDENLKYNGYDNLFVCDLSVFPTSPAANPTLTLTALSLKLADYIRGLP